MESSASVPLSSTAAAVAQPADRSARVWLSHPVTGYLFALLLVFATHGAIALTWHEIGYASFTVCVAAVALAALFGGTGPGLTATVLLSLDIDYSYMPPYHSLLLDSFQSVLRLMAFCTVAIIISSLQGRRHKAEESLRAARDELEARVARRTAELLRSREQFRLLVNGFLDQAFFMLDDAGNVAGWNSGAERLLGYPENQIVGKALTTLWPDADRRDTGNPGPSAINPSRYEHHDWIVRKDGSRFWGSIFLAPLEAGDGPHLHGGQAVTIRDLTERRSLEREILDISERERVRIGHDLHDGLGQELSGTAMLSIALARRLTDSEFLTGATAASAAADAEEIADLIHESIRHTRELARGLCPFDMDEEGLPSAIRQLAERVDRLPGVHCQCELPARVGVDSAVALHLHRIAQEAINNAVRHGKSSLIQIRLFEANGQLTLIVADDGVGISDTPDPSATSAGSGLGLRLMRYRAKMIGGAVQISRGSPRGTVVTCQVATQTDSMSRAKQRVPSEVAELARENGHV